MKMLSLALLAALVAAGMWTATQYVASSLDYAPELGPPWMVVRGTPVYRPWAWFGWNDRWGRRFPVLFRNASGMTTAASLVGIALVALVASRRPRSNASVAHGSSR